MNFSNKPKSQFPKTQYSIFPVFQHSNCERSELSSHTDGNIWKIFDLIIETGIDGIHPIDPMADMDLGEAKAKYGKKICLMGNVNCGSTLSWGTIEEVRQEVKDCIRKAGYGGGYICASSNSIHSGVKPENYVAMVKAIREYGRYPLKL